MEVHIGLSRDLRGDGLRDGDEGLVEGCGEDNSLVSVRATGALNSPLVALGSDTRDWCLQENVGTRALQELLEELEVTSDNPSSVVGCHGTRAFESMYSVHVLAIIDTGGGFNDFVNVTRRDPLREKVFRGRARCEGLEAERRRNILDFLPMKTVLRVQGQV